MQAAKDSFYMELRNRLAMLNAAHTVSVNGIVQPAVLAEENSSLTAAEMPPDCFLLRFGAARVVPGWEGGEGPLMSLDCGIRYRTQAKLDGTSRGRTLGAMDAELLALCRPGLTAKLDYRQTPPAGLGSNVVWVRPQLGDPEEDNGALRREAKLELFFFPEVAA